jgi:hypothetical protein
MPRLLSQFAPPVLCLGLLAAMSYGDTLGVDWTAAAPFHARVRTAMDKVPHYIGLWEGHDEEFDRDALVLLKPNAKLQRLYTRYHSDEAVGMLIVQCADPRNMVGHYPEICYPSAGWNIDKAEAQDWHAGRLVIPGVEYTISQERPTPRGPVRIRRIVRDFFVLPDGTMARDMDAIRAAAKTYRHLAFGAAQIQLLFEYEASPAQRDTDFNELVGDPEMTSLIETLQAGGTQ